MTNFYIGQQVINLGITATVVGFHKITKDLILEERIPRKPNPHLAAGCIRTGLSPSDKTCGEGPLRRLFLVICTQTPPHIFVSFMPPK